MLLLYDRIRGDLKKDDKDKGLDKNVLNNNVKKYDRHKLRAILRKYIRHCNRLLNYHRFKEVIDNFEPFKNIFITYSNSFLNKNKIFNYDFRYSKIIKILYLNKKGKRLIYGDNNYVKENSSLRNKKGRNNERTGLLLDDMKYTDEDDTPSEDKRFELINLNYTLKKGDFEKLDNIIVNSEIALPTFSYFDIYLFSNNKKLKYEINKKNIKYIDIDSVLYYLYISVVIAYIHLKDFHNAKIKFFEYIYLKRKLKKINKYCSESEKRKLRITSLISSELKSKIYNYYDLLLYEKKASSLLLKKGVHVDLQKEVTKGRNSNESTNKNSKENENKNADKVNDEIYNKFIITSNINEDEFSKERECTNNVIKKDKNKTATLSMNGGSLFGDSTFKVDSNILEELKNINCLYQNENSYSGNDKDKGEEDKKNTINVDNNYIDRDVVTNGKFLATKRRIHFSNKRKRENYKYRKRKKKRKRKWNGKKKYKEKEYLTLDEYLLFLKIKYKEISLERLIAVLKNTSLEDKICSMKRLRNLMNIEYNEKTNLLKKEKFFKNLIKIKDRKYYFYNYFFDVLIYFSYFKQIHIIEGLLVMALLYSKLNILNVSLYIYKNLYLYFYFIFEDYQKKWKSFDINHEMNKLNSFTIRTKENNTNYINGFEHIRKGQNSKKKHKKKKKKKKNGIFNENHVPTNDSKGEKYNKRHLCAVTSKFSRSTVGGNYGYNNADDKDNGNTGHSTNANGDDNNNDDDDDNNDDDDDNNNNDDVDDNDNFDRCSAYDEVIVHTFRHFLNQLKDNSCFYFINDCAKGSLNSKYRNYSFLNNPLMSPHFNHINDLVIKNFIKNSISFNYKYICNGIKRHILIYLNLINHIETKFMFYQYNYNLKNLIYHLYLDKIIKCYDSNLFTYEKNLYVLKRIIFLDNKISIFHAKNNNYLTNDYSLKSTFFRIYFNLYKNEFFIPHYWKQGQQQNIPFIINILDSKYNLSCTHFNKQGEVKVKGENYKEISFYSIINLKKKKNYLCSKEGNPQDVQKQSHKQLQKHAQVQEHTEAQLYEECDSEKNTSKGPERWVSNIPYEDDFYNFNILLNSNESVDKYILSNYINMCQKSINQKKDVYTNGEFKCSTNSFNKIRSNVQEFYIYTKSQDLMNYMHHNTNYSYGMLNDKKRYNSDIVLNKSDPIIKTHTLDINYRNTYIPNNQDGKEFVFDENSYINKLRHVSCDNLYKNNNINGTNNGRKNDNFIESIFFKKRINKKLFNVNKNIHDEEDTNNWKNQNLKNFFNFRNNELKILIYNFLYLFIFDEYIYMNIHRKDISEYFNFVNVLKKKQKLRYNFYNLLYKSNKDIGNEISYYKKYLKENYLHNNNRKDKKIYTSIFGEKTTIHVNVKKDMNDKCKTKSPKKLSITGEEYKMIREHMKISAPIASLLINNKQHYNSRILNLLRDTYKKNFINYHMKINIEKYEHICFLFLITEMLSLILLPYINLHYSFTYIKYHKNVHRYTINSNDNSYSNNKFTSMDKFRFENKPFSYDEEMTFQKGNNKGRRKRLLKGTKREISASIYNILNMRRVKFFTFAWKKKKKRKKKHEPDSAEAKNRKTFYKKNTFSNIKNETAYIQKYSLFNEEKKKWRNTLFNKKNSLYSKKEMNTKFSQHMNDNIYYVSFCNFKELHRQLRSSWYSLTFEAKTVIENVFLFNDYYQVDIYKLNEKFHNKGKYFLIKKYEKIIALSFFTRYNTYLIFSLYQRVALLNYLYSNYNVVISILRYINHVHCKLMNQHSRNNYRSGNVQVVYKNNISSLEKNVYGKLNDDSFEKRKHFFNIQQDVSDFFFYMKDEDINYDEYIINTYSTNYINDKNYVQDKNNLFGKKTFYEKMGEIRSFRFSLFFDIFFELKVNYNYLSNAHICVQNSLKYLFFFIKNAHKFNLLIDSRQKEYKNKTKKEAQRDEINTAESGREDETKYKKSSKVNNKRNGEKNDHFPHGEVTYIKTNSAGNSFHENLGNPQRNESDVENYTNSEETIGNNTNSTTDVGVSSNELGRKNSNCNDKRHSQHVHYENCFLGNKASCCDNQWHIKEKYIKSNIFNKIYKNEINIFKEDYLFDHKIDINKFRSSKLFYIIGISLLKQINTNYYYNNLKEINLVYEKDLIKKKININNIVKNDYTELLYLSYKYIMKSIKVDHNNLLSYYYLCIIYLYNLKIDKCIYIVKNFLLKNYHNAYSFPFFLLSIVVSSCRNLNGIKNCSKDGSSKCDYSWGRRRKKEHMDRSKFCGNSIKMNGNKKGTLCNSCIFDSYENRYKSLINQLKLNSPLFYNSITSSNNLFRTHEEKKGCYVNKFCNITNLVHYNEGASKLCSMAKEDPNEAHVDVANNASEYIKGEHTSRTSHSSFGTYGMRSKNIEMNPKGTECSFASDECSYSSPSCYCRGTVTNTPSANFDTHLFQSKLPSKECILIISKAVNYFSNNFFFIYLYVYYLINIFIIYDILFFWEKPKKNEKNNSRNKAHLKYWLLQDMLEKYKTKSGSSSSSDICFLDDKNFKERYFSRSYDIIFDDNEHDDINIDNKDDCKISYESDKCDRCSQYDKRCQVMENFTVYHYNIPTVFSNPRNLTIGKKAENKILTNSIMEEIDKIQISLKILERKSNMKTNAKKEKEEGKLFIINRKKNKDSTTSANVNVNVNENKRNSKLEYMFSKWANVSFMDTPHQYEYTLNDRYIPSGKKKNINKSEYIDISKVNLLPCSIPIILILYKYVDKQIKRKKNSDMYMHFYLNNFLSHINLNKIKCELHQKDQSIYVDSDQIDNSNCFFSYSKECNKLFNKNYYFSIKSKKDNTDNDSHTDSVNNTGSYENIGSADHNDSTNNIYGNNNNKGIRKISLKSVYLEAITWLGLGEILIYLKVNAKLIIYFINIIDTYIKFYLSLNNKNNYYNFENTTFFYNLTHHFMCLKCLYLFYLYSKCEKRLRSGDYIQRRQNSVFIRNDRMNFFFKGRKNKMKSINNKNLYTKIYFFEKEHEFYNIQMKLSHQPKIVLENNYIYFNDKFSKNDFKLAFRINDKKAFKRKFWPLKKKKKMEKREKIEQKKEKMNRIQENITNYSYIKKNEAKRKEKKDINNKNIKKSVSKLYADAEMLFNSFHLEGCTKNRQKKYRLIKNIKIYVSLINKIYYNDRKVNILYARYYFLKKKYLKVISILSLLNKHYKKKDYIIKKKNKAHGLNFEQNNLSAQNVYQDKEEKLLFHLNNQTDLIYEYLNIYMYYQSFLKLKNYKKSNYYKNILNIIFFKFPIIPFNIFPFINL
ncbi:conserved Plasmodium protein, unknown function [Plasmodium malariae]|uniref:Uncharacterized protein n=1 Tax=Plasmodium malariae TaxID=5858 RepID=A0A1C3L1F4_PLAMA|nr:conserved Plasmodium protein, unknown function [Plasmodium malariae]